MSALPSRHGWERLDADRAKLLAVSNLAGLAGVAAHSAWPTLDPLPEAASTAPQPFPFAGLGQLLGDAARAIADGVQAPDALAAGSVLASAALAAQAHADIVMPHGQRSPLSVMVITGAKSGDRKSATDAVASKPAEDHRREQARQHAVGLQEFEQAQANRQKGTIPEPAPVACSLTVSKATVEGLHALLRNQPHVGVFSGEGGELLGGHSMREDRRCAGLAWYLKAWGAETLDTLTRGDGLSILLGRRVSLHALVQPVLLRGLLIDPLAQGQGFLARCFVAEPASLAGTRLFKLGNPNEEPAVKMYHAALRHLLSTSPVTNPHGDGNELETRPLHMSDDAAALWIEFYNAVEADQADGKPLSAARAFASKAAEHAARIAGIVQIVENPMATEVTASTMAGAIEVTVFYISEHLRLTGAGIDDRRYGLLRMLAEWMQSRGTVPHSDVLQRAPNPIRALKAPGIAPLLDELTQRGYIRRKNDQWEARP